MTGPIFDTHAHYSARAFDADRFALLDSLPEKGVVGVCEQATHSGDAPRVLELAHRYPWVYAAIGIHPESLLAPEDCGEEGPAPTVSVFGGDWAAEMKALAPCYDDPKVVAVGECGLDYHWPVPKDAQLALFEAEIRLALELDKPIIVHDRNAHADVYALLKKYRPKGIVHCYSGSADDAVWLAKQGLSIGFGGAGRRFEHKGEYHGAVVYDDYAHHPHELQALLSTVKTLGYQRVICAFQPHTYTRTKELFDDFVEVLKLPDKVLLAEIFAARETDTLGISSKDLADRIPNAEFCPTLEDVTTRFKELAQPGDLLITVGAGDIYLAGEALLKQA